MWRCCVTGILFVVVVHCVRGCRGVIDSNSDLFQALEPLKNRMDCVVQDSNHVNALCKHLSIAHG